MVHEKFIGTGIALVTPFKENHKIDFDALRSVLNHTSQGGVNYWVVMGTTGESATLTKEEKVAVLEFVLQNNPLNLPIVYGIGGNNTHSIIEDIGHTPLDGVDAILSVSPYYNKPSQEGIYQHYMMLADQSPKPIILYNVPGRTASNISAHTTLRLAQHENIVGVKEASGDLVQCIEIAKNKPEDFLLISGDDMLTIPMMSVGGQGVISVLANAFPSIFSEMVADALAGNYRKASQNLYQLNSINPLMYTESNPVGVKHAMALQGVCGNTVRLPLLPASEGLQAQIAEMMPATVEVQN
ncbi:4-hydroxy-tetrahydrodipicolinate synthase [uncultured Microscilla sp.]|uniref:4-hydroxy-tetrahydrodipicolinate synthase n=1 Tax=uncultured Microscilla sp. TaxID=432653 RepID=UPI002614389E|nr:4-hydroxy-tetrahydrodipicolinate synthase [uncultured Microscilla sp.]